MMKRHDYWFSEWRLISFFFKLLILIKHTAGITIDTADKHWKISWTRNIICMICRISRISNIFMPPILQNIYLFWNSWNENKFSFICRWQNFFLDQQAAPKQHAAAITAIIPLLNIAFASFIITPILFTFIISIF